MSDSGHSTVSNTSNAYRKLVIIIIVLLLLVIISLGIVVVLLLNNSNEKTVPETIAGGRGTVVTKENVEEIKQQAAEPVQDGYYTTTMTIDWHFDGTVSKDAYVANDTPNTRTVYFDLFREDNGELIYSSPYIPVGEELKGITLDTELQPGTYETILVYHLVDDNEQELSTLSIALTIYVN